MARWTYQYAKSDTLASQMAAGASSGTLSSGNFANFTGDYLVLDYDTSSKEIIKCNVTGTAIASATRGLGGTSDATHAAGAKVGYMWLPLHATHVSVAAEEGWTEAQDTWVYASASTFTISGVDRTAIYVAGTKLRFKQGGGYKYAYVASSSFSTDTTVTIDVNTDYTIANAAITDAYFSYAQTPQGFPYKFAFTTTSTGLTETSGTKAAEFTREGKWISGQIRFAFGASSAVTASPTFTLPVTASSFFPTANTGVIGHVELYDASPGANYVGVFRRNSSTVGGVLSLGASSVETAISSTAPFTWTTSDEIVVTFRYLAA